MKRKLLALLASLGLVVGLAACNASVANTGPPTAQQPCTTNHNGTLTISVDNTTIDRYCVNGGTVVVDADNVTIKNSVLTAAPPSDFVGVFIAEGATGTLIDHNEIDCAGNVASDPNAASWGIQGSNYEAVANEIRNCSDGLVMGANVWFHHNLIHLPDTSGDLHPDGVQMTGEADNWLFEWNNVNFPGTSSSFQYHGAENGSGQNSNGVVRYNKFEGGASVLRIPGEHESCLPPNPSCGPWDGNEVYGNRIGVLDSGEFWRCTGNPDSIEVWGAEKPPQADWNNDSVINSQDQFGEWNVIDDPDGPLNGWQILREDFGDIDGACSVNFAP